MDAKKTAQQVLEQVGGAENVTFLTHCVTRLRFNLKSMDGVDEAKVKAVPGVVGVVNSIRSSSATKWLPCTMN